MRFTVFTLILLFFMECGHAEDLVNLLQNGDFEAGAAGWDLKNASIEGDANNRWLVAKTAWARAQQDVALQDGWKKIKITAMMRLTDVVKGKKSHENARVALAWINGEDKAFTYPSHVIGGSGSTDGWQIYEQVCEIPEGAVKLRIYPGMLGKKGKAEFDDITLTVVPADTYVTEKPNINKKELPSAEKFIPKKLDLTGYKLVWNDEFNGFAGSGMFSPSKWKYSYFGWRNNGYQSAKSVKLNGKGRLTITNWVEEMPEEHKKQDGKYRFHTGMIYTKGLFQAAYGYWEACIKMQEIPGSWSAFWNISPKQVKGEIIGDPGRAGMEVDIMEYIENPARHDLIMHALHWDGYKKDHKTDKYRGKKERLSEGFHIFGVEWTPERYTFYVDGVSTWAFSKAISHVPHYALLSTEIMFDSWAGDIRKYREKLPDTFTVDYVRVWQTSSQRLTLPFPVLDTFDIGNKPSTGNDADDTADIGWSTRNARVETTSSDSGLGSGNAMLMEIEPGGEVISETVDDPWKLKQVGDTLHFSFDMKISDKQDSRSSLILKMITADNKEKATGDVCTLSVPFSGSSVAVQAIGKSLSVSVEEKETPEGDKKFSLLDGEVHRVEFSFKVAKDEQIKIMLHIDGRAGETIFHGKLFNSSAFEKLSFGAHEKKLLVMVDNIEIRSTPGTIKGDLDANGQMTRIDRPLLQKAIESRKEYQTFYPEVDISLAADMNSDGKIDNHDLVEFDRIISTLPETTTLH